MQKKGANISLKGYDDIFSTDQSRAEAQQERVQEIPLSELHPFEGHPFRVVDDEEMMKTVESVRDFGVLTPAIVRPDSYGGYEIISGHRRHRASELAGKETMPAIVRDMDDDAAIILMVDSNLQRETLLPSERAFAYIHGFEVDIKTVEAHPQISEGFCGMEIMGKHYAEKADAGEIILAACKETKSADPVPLGSYRGFQMELSYDSFRSEFDIVLKGAMSHRVALGTDARGNITRLDNVLSGIPERLKRANEQLTNLYNQQEAAKAELGKPFPQEAELAAKSQRLAELDAALNMEDTVENRAEKSEAERPSVLADLKSKAENIPPVKRSEGYEEVL